MMCIGINDRGNERICFCVARQYKGCNDRRMKVASNEDYKNNEDLLKLFMSIESKF